MTATLTVMPDDGALSTGCYDVVWSDADQRQRGADGKLPPVGVTVDVANASWTNTIGDPELIAVWRDPDFDPGRRAFYYARVIEIPTPRWTAYDAKRFGTEMPADARMTTQERAYTHPSGTRRTPEVVTPRQRITQARRSCDGNVRSIFQVDLRARRSRIC